MSTVRHKILGNDTRMRTHTHIDIAVGSLQCQKSASTVGLASCIAMF